MCLGVMPRESVARVYGLKELYDLGLAIRRGDLRSFEELVQRHQKSFIRLGVYLVLEQAKNIAYRSLFKRIAIITASPKMNLVIVERVMKCLGENDIDLDEIECILSNLIYRNQVKGYISHQKRYLIISKADPFPVNAIVKRAKPI
jgi:nuclear mRNA export protein PCID2/THP1